MSKKFMFYSRDESGLITRTHRASVIDDTENYTRQEPLYGWPERHVFWRVMADGSAIGIAPMTKRVSDHAISITQGKPNV